MIGKVLRGERPAGLIYYLYGPGKYEEHTDPHIVDPGDVVGVRVGKQHRIRARNPAAQELISHIRRGIN